MAKASCLSVSLFDDTADLTVKLSGNFMSGGYTILPEFTVCIPSINKLSEAKRKTVLSGKVFDVIVEMTQSSEAGKLVIELDFVDVYENM